MQKRPWKNFLIFWITLILIATLLPGKQLQKIPGTDMPAGTDLVIHYLLFTGLGFLLSAYLKADKNNVPVIRSILTVALYGILFGAFTEFLQLILPLQRDASFYDLAADIAGITTGIVFFILMTRKEKKMS